MSKDKYPSIFSPQMEAIVLSFKSFWQRAQFSKLGNIDLLLTERYGRTGGRDSTDRASVQKRPRANIPQYGSRKLG